MKILVTQSSWPHPHTCIGSGWGLYGEACPLSAFTITKSVRKNCDLPGALLWAGDLRSHLRTQLQRRRTMWVPSSIIYFRCCLADPALDIYDSDVDFYDRLLWIGKRQDYKLAKLALDGTFCVSSDGPSKLGQARLGQLFNAMGKTNLGQTLASFGYGTDSDRGTKKAVTKIEKLIQKKGFKKTAVVTDAPKVVVIPPVS